MAHALRGARAAAAAAEPEAFDGKFSHNTSKVLDIDTTDKNHLVLTNLIKEGIITAFGSNSENKLSKQIEEYDKIKKILIPIIDNAISQSFEEINYTSKNLKI